MSAEKLLFNFSRKLPSPFDKLGYKKVKVASKYAGGATEATLTSTVLKAIISYCKCLDGSSLGAVGKIDHRTVAEYKSSIDADETYYLVVYDPDGGNVMASIYNKNTEIISQYTLHKDKMDGAAIIMAAIPELLNDEEFEDAFHSFNAECRLGFPDINKVAESAGLLCDNVYRRVKDKACPAHIKVNIDSGGNPARISPTHLDSNTFVPTSITAGEFNIFTQSPVKEVYTPSAATDHSDFVGQYKFNSARMLTIFEQQLIPILNSSYILPPEIINVCKHAQKSTGKQTQMRNFLLRGPAGTGKTAGAMAIAAGLGLPYMKYTCSANSEIFDFIGQVFPETDSASTGDTVLDNERKTLKEMGGINYENVAKLMNLPGLDDMDYDPVGVYQLLTGIEKSDASSQDCMAIVLNTVADKIQKLCRVKPESQSTGQIYTYVETDFIKALKHGYLVEIQERATRSRLKRSRTNDRNTAV